MKATDMLKKQHREVLSLFKKAISSDDAGERRDLVDEIARQLRLHTQLEEQIFYPAYREVAGSKKAEEQVLEAYEEHHVVDLVLAELPDVDLEAESFKAKLTVLKELVEHHVEEEQEEMFPAAEKKLGKDRLDEIAREMQSAAEEHGTAEAEAAMH